MNACAHASVRTRLGWRAPLRVGAAVVATWVLTVAGWAQSSREYDLKAVFLYNFATFVEWPERAFSGPEDPIVIGVLGEDPFGPALDEVVAGERVKGRPLVVLRCDTLAQAKACHILFISASERERLATVLRETAGRPILTVGDVPRFVDTGGLVGFSSGPRLQLHINAAAARERGLVISSKLLRVAVVREIASNE